MLFPKGQITRIDPKTGKGSTIDLVIGSPKLSHLELKTSINGGSDPLPIIIKDNSHNTETQELEFNKEGWVTYNKDIQKIDMIKIKSLKEITEIMINIGKKIKIDNDFNKNKPRKM